MIFHLLQHGHRICPATFRFLFYERINPITRESGANFLFAEPLRGPTLLKFKRLLLESRSLDVNQTFRSLKVCAGDFALHMRDYVEIVRNTPPSSLAPESEYTNTIQRRFAQIFDNPSLEETAMSFCFWILP